MLVVHHSSKVIRLYFSVYSAFICSKCNIVPAGQFPLNCFQMFCARSERLRFSIRPKNGISWIALNGNNNISHFDSDEEKLHIRSRLLRNANIFSFGSSSSSTFLPWSPLLPRIHTNVCFVVVVAHWIQLFQFYKQCAALSILHMDRTKCFSNRMWIIFKAATMWLFLCVYLW